MWRWERQKKVEVGKPVSGNNKPVSGNNSRQ